MKKNKYVKSVNISTVTANQELQKQITLVKKNEKEGK